MKAFTIFAFLCFSTFSQATDILEVICGAKIENGNCKGGAPNFESLLNRLNPPGGVPNASAVLIPKGRSLQRKDADFKNPRVVVASSNSSPQEYFIGFTKNKKEIELIRKNPQTGENEFFIIKNFPDAPKIAKQHGSTCTTCHTNGTPLFAAGPWSETNANPRVALKLCQEIGGGTYEGVRVTGDCKKLEAELKEKPNAMVPPSNAQMFAIAFGVDASVRRNAKKIHDRANICSQICASSGDLEKDKNCKRSLLQLALISQELNPVQLPVIPTKPEHLLKDFYNEEMKRIFPFINPQSGPELSEKEKSNLQKIYNESLKNFSLSKVDEGKKKKLLSLPTTSVIGDLDPLNPDDDKSHLFYGFEGENSLGTMLDPFYAAIQADVQRRRRGEPPSRDPPPHVEKLLSALTEIKLEEDEIFDLQDVRGLREFEDLKIPEEYFPYQVAVKARGCFFDSFIDLVPCQTKIQKALAGNNAAIKKLLDKAISTDWKGLSSTPTEVEKLIKPELMKFCTEKSEVCEEENGDELNLFLKSTKEISSKIQSE